MNVRMCSVNKEFYGPTRWEGRDSVSFQFFTLCLFLLILQSYRLYCNKKGFYVQYHVPLKTYLLGMRHQRIINEVQTVKNNLSVLLCKWYFTKKTSVSKSLL